MDIPSIAPTVLLILSTIRVDYVAVGWCYYLVKACLPCFSPCSTKVGVSLMSHLQCLAQWLAYNVWSEMSVD